MFVFFFREQEKIRFRSVNGNPCILALALVQLSVEFDGNMMGAHDGEEAFGCAKYVRTPHSGCVM